MFWVGAGVSASPPAGLPLGESLTRFVLSEACGSTSGEKLETLWSHARALCLEMAADTPLPALPRLESVLGAIGRLEANAPADLQFLPGLRCMADAPPNVNHLLLARLVCRGALVVTTNFDLCLQSAVARVAGVSCGPTVRDGMFHHDACPGGGAIVHVHGCADAPDGLGATLSAVKGGFAPGAARMLDTRLLQGAVVVWLGYGAGDAFDVTPWFASRGPGAWSSSASVFVQHGTASVPTGVERLTRGFGRRVVGNADTTRLLEALAGPAPPVPERCFDWCSAFRAEVAGYRAREARPVTGCAVANELGVNVAMLSPGLFSAAAARNPGFRFDRYHDTLALSGRGRGDAAAERSHREQVGDPADRLGYFYAIGDLTKARRHALTVSEIGREAARPGPIEWRAYTSMSVHARLFVEPFLRRPWRRPAGRDARRLRELESAAGLLATRDVADMVAVHQPLTAMRLQLVLAALGGEPPDRDREAQILERYGEQSNLQGFTGAWRDVALCRALAMRGHGPRRSLWDEGRRAARASRRLARLTGDARAARRARAAEALLAWAWISLPWSGGP